jgi:hypothetical protein
MRTNITSEHTIDEAELAGVTGGAGWGAAARTAAGVAGRVGSKLVPGLNIASTAYSAYEAGSAYSEARDGGAGYGAAAWEGAKAFVVGR